MTRIVALVPMRHHSQRVPGKNYRILDGKPLFHHIIQTLLHVPEISEIVVDTDSPDVISGLAAHFPAVKVIDRPEDLRADDTPMNEILAFDTSQVAADFYLQTHSTNETFTSQVPIYDSLFSVTRLQTRLWNQSAQPINHDPAVLLQTQDLPPVYEENSCIYIFTRQNLLARRNRMGTHPLMFEIDAEEAWDIDEELDFSIADFLMRN